MRWPRLSYQWKPYSPLSSKSNHTINPSTQRALRTLGRENILEPVKPTTPTQFDIFNQVFVNSSPPDEIILQTANQLLNAIMESRTMPSIPVTQYIQNLTSRTEQLRARSIVHRHDANNLRSIVKKCVTCKREKGVILKGYFYISIQKLCDTVIEAEKATKKQEGRKREIKGKAVIYVV